MPDFVKTLREANGGDVAVVAVLPRGGAGADVDAFTANARTASKVRGALRALGNVTIVTGSCDDPATLQASPPANPPIPPARPRTTPNARSCCGGCARGCRSRPLRQCDHPWRLDCVELACILLLCAAAELFECGALRRRVRRRAQPSPT